MRVEDVPDPKIEQPTDAIIRVTTSAICGSDLHLYEVMGPFIEFGSVLGHEPMGIVEEVGSEVTELAKGDRVVIPFQISCGHCLMCDQGLQTQCETTQVREEGMGATLFGYTKPYGNPARRPGRAPARAAGAVHAREGARRPARRALRLPVRRAAHRLAGRRVCRDPGRRLGVRARPRGDRRHVDADRAGPDSVIDAVGMDAHGSPGAKLAQQVTGLLPDAIAGQLMGKAGLDRMHAFYLAIDIVRRGGTISLIGVYGGMAAPLPMLTLFDEQIQLRMGQANVKRWTPDILPLLTDGDPLGAEELHTHQAPPAEAPRAYEMFQKKQDGAVKALLKP